jgi:hypothetical protein
MDEEQQQQQKRSPLFINKGNTQESINKIIKSIPRPLHSQYNFENENSMKRCILLILSFVCFATFVVQNLHERGRKTEKNKGKA